MRTSALLAILLTTAVVTQVGRPSPAAAHCDTMDGPVVKAGQRALATGDLDHALVWIERPAEPELRAAFKQARAVRRLRGDARELADRYFLETLVRLHRAGEGEPFTGIHPAGTELGIVIPLAEASITSGSADALAAQINAATTAGLKARLARVRAARGYRLHDVARGRTYVSAYVDYLHYAEQAYAAAARSAAVSTHEHHE